LLQIITTGNVYVKLDGEWKVELADDFIRMAHSIFKCFGFKTKKSLILIGLSGFQ
jgi:hypothetical protein